MFDAMSGVADSIETYAKKQNTDLVSNSSDDAFKADDRFIGMKKLASDSKAKRSKSRNMEERNFIE